MAYYFSKGVLAISSPDKGLGFDQHECSSLGSAE
jgi:hypothetical protein